MVAGFVGVTEARPFELGVQARARPAVERLVLDLRPVCLPYPLIQGLIGSKSCWTLETLFKTGQDFGGSEGRLPAGAYNANKASSPPAAYRTRQGPMVLRWRPSKRATSCRVGACPLRRS
jgi:hypothetical protein